MVIHVPDRKDLVTGFIFSALSAAAIAFIFSNSLQPAAVSGALSGGLLEKVNAFLSGAGLPAISEKLLRKTAHLCEFGLLGILTLSAACCFSGAALPRTRRRAAVTGFTVSFAVCALTAISDEIIQYFVPGRACLVTDMLIDASGAALGTLLCAVVARLVRKRRKRTQN